MHFENRRNRASLLAYGGSTLASLVYPGVLMTLVDVYGLHGALLFTAGLALNGLAGSVMLRKPTWITADDPDKPILIVAVAEVDLPLPAGTTGTGNVPAVGLEGGDQNVDGVDNALTVQCLLNGGVLFLMSLFDKGTLLVVLGLGFGWTSGSVITLTVPVLKSNLDASRVQFYAELSRFAAAAALPLGPVLVGVFKDGKGSYSGLFLVSGLLSLIGGFIWLPAILKDSKSSALVEAEVMPCR
ncbi:hypothetical protein IscW_ISCW018531 [Ixodes scapularis]|uniref:Monocarboxylate transporter n=1 Tax=Ixodes scapularis TaxID=6945 RepID=B7PQ03_IXOSC|nr:hypothetical protein IscW_ISCW018531 [Ixodes scapularis]|eukprot:XP_002435845.1 hypothetical protein IscW_ISCW018531 [Ixodes scapularis]